MKKVIISVVLVSAACGIFVGAAAAQASADTQTNTVQTVTIKPIVLEAGGSAGLK